MTTIPTITRRRQHDGQPVDLPPLVVNVGIGGKASDSPSARVRIIFDGVRPESDPDVETMVRQAVEFMLGGRWRVMAG